MQNILKVDKYLLYMECLLLIIVAIFLLFLGSISQINSPIYSVKILYILLGMMLLSISILTIIALKKIKSVWSKYYLLFLTIAGWFLFFGQIVALHKVDLLTILLWNIPLTTITFSIYKNTTN